MPLRQERAHERPDAARSGPVALVVLTACLAGSPLANPEELQLSPVDQDLVRGGTPAAPERRDLRAVEEASRPPLDEPVSDGTATVGTSADARPDNTVAWLNLLLATPLQAHPVALVAPGASSAQISSDGSRIHHRVGPDALLLDRADGQSFAVPDGMMSSDGQSIVYMDETGPAPDECRFVEDTQCYPIYYYRVASRSVTLVAGGRYPSVSGDGSHIAYRRVIGLHVEEIATGLEDHASVSTSASRLSTDGSVVVSLEGRGLWLWDRKARTTTQICIKPDGSRSGGSCVNPRISGDGRRVVFESYATDILPGNDPVRTHVYVYDRVANAISRISASDAGVAGNGQSRNASISPDGRYVVFESTASNLVASDTNGATDVFLKDLSTGSLTRLSLTATGDQSNGPSARPTVSADGRWVAFESSATNLTWEGVGGVFLVGPLDH